MDYLLLIIIGLLIVIILLLATPLIVSALVILFCVFLSILFILVSVAVVIWVGFIFIYEVIRDNVKKLIGKIRRIRMEKRSELKCYNCKWEKEVIRRFDNLDVPWSCCCHENRKDDFTTVTDSETKEEAVFLGIMPVMFTTGPTDCGNFELKDKK